MCGEHIIHISRKLVEIGHDRNESIAKPGLFKMLNENIRTKLRFNLNTTKYFAGHCSLFLSFLPLSTVPVRSASFTVAMTDL